MGSGYWGNDITSGTTLYITKNQGTTANITTDWEIHGQKTVASVPAGQFSKITPGSAFTDKLIGITVICDRIGGNRRVAFGSYRSDTLSAGNTGDENTVQTGTTLTGGTQLLKNQLLGGAAL